jgi:hypothetical protein
MLMLSLLASATAAADTALDRLEIVEQELRELRASHEALLNVLRQQGMPVGRLGDKLQGDAVAPTRPRRQLADASPAADAVEPASIRLAANNVTSVDGGMHLAVGPSYKVGITSVGVSIEGSLATSGDVDVEGMMSVGRPNPNERLTLEQSNYIGWDSTVGNAKAKIGFDGSDDTLRLYNPPTAPSRLTVQPNGKVGIGTGGPHHMLSIVSATNAVMSTCNNGVHTVTATKFVGAGSDGQSTDVFISYADAGIDSSTFGGYILHRITAGGYASSGSNSMTWEALHAGYSGHSGGGTSHSYHPVTILATQIANGQLAIYNPDPSTYGVTVTNEASYGLSIIIKAEFTFQRADSHGMC